MPMEIGQPHEVDLEDDGAIRPKVFETFQVMIRDQPLVGDVIPEPILPVRMKVLK